MKVLGIETSCDETGAAIVEGNGNKLKLLSNFVASSADLHKQYGGVVPEIAARSHIEAINPVVRQAMEEAGCNWGQVDAISVTKGPGLGGSLLVGVLTARTLAILRKKPLYGVNHVLAHMYASFITDAQDSYKLAETAPEFPLLSLTVSGGHTQLVYFESHFKYSLLGATSDDAVGEAYDKVAKILGLPYPGGPSVEKLAKEGDPSRYPLPKAKTKEKYGFSYSGLKTAVLRLAQSEIGQDYSFPSHMVSERLSARQKKDIAACFNKVAMEVLADKARQAVEEYAPKSVVVSGGVSASPELRRQMKDSLSISPIFADPKLCTDNGAMIAAAGYFMARGKISPDDPKDLDIIPNLSM
ncbi:MAG TPA: tRNA (adenosine(37)-N6)-threonylcarbamoyltransferase complex transferase subunit TsaD [Candidatus Saccharimonadales bacterium]|nr:tRNA (adenosine(37)-N6)-threonylcarbamoyltransferase complex transferase subunit TsaD [Candidatus Saccharimonadales bacterium]